MKLVKAIGILAAGALTFIVTDAALRAGIVAFQVLSGDTKMVYHFGTGLPVSLVTDRRTCTERRDGLVDGSLTVRVAIPTVGAKFGLPVGSVLYVRSIECQPGDLASVMAANRS